VATISYLFGHLATDFTALIGRGMDVKIPLAGHQVGGLGISQRRVSFERAFCGRVRENWDLHGSVVTGFGRSAESLLRSNGNGRSLTFL
jgi:hypothetical protein